MVFNSLMIEFFEGSNTEELIPHMFVHIKAQVEIPRMSENGFMLDQIMHLDMNFLKLASRRGTSYTEFFRMNNKE